MPDDASTAYAKYSPHELAEKYCISIQQANRYIRRFGSRKKELDRLLSAAERTPVHRASEIDRTSRDVTFG
ncbi:hypothetical protein [Neorhizobium alkalisoli]|uniref:hypothetical protein n=1 Tax=Neorhizobium alkalisoli TaxID=528178 RepID=UPI001319F4FF|nr:hypothetical protein [Neorhizobium alkalisoli]